MIYLFSIGSFSPDIFSFLSSLQIWQGVVTSIRQHEKNILMCVDTVHKVVRRDTALQIIKSIAEQKGNYKENCIRELVGCIVMTR